MIGYDLDGTLCEGPPKRSKPYFKQNGAERKAYEEVRREHYRTAREIRTPKTPFVVITGRSEKYRDETEAWLSEHGFEPVAVEMLQTSRTRENMIEHKLAACRKHAVTQYWEDDSKIAQALGMAGICVVKVGDNG